jgi:hypothetical protein
VLACGRPQRVIVSARTAETVLYDALAADPAAPPGIMMPFGAAFSRDGARLAVFAGGRVFSALLQRAGGLRHAARRTERRAVVGRAGAGDNPARSTPTMCDAQARARRCTLNTTGKTDLEQRSHRRRVA